MIEDHQIKVHSLLEASLNEVKRNTNTWNMLYALGLIGFTSTPEAVIWTVANCIIAARAVRAETTEVYFIVAYRQLWYVWVNGFHPDEAAQAVWNRLAQLWMQAKWSQGIRSFDRQSRVIQEDGERIAERHLDHQPIRLLVEVIFELETRRERMRADEFESQVDFEWRKLCQEAKFAHAFRREQEATRDLSIYEAARDFLATFPPHDPEQVSTPAAEPPDNPEPVLKPATDEVDSASSVATDLLIFRKQGEVWRIVDESGKELLLKDMKGFGYIAYLLRHPRPGYGIFDLIAAVEGAPAANDIVSLANLSEPELDEQGLHVSEGNEGLPAYDQTTKEQLAKELEKLSAERAQAEASHDTEELARINHETEQIAEYLRSGEALGGRIRQHASDANRARNRVGHVVADAIDKIKAHNPALAKHLKDAIRIQIADSEYKPDAATTWQT